MGDYEVDYSNVLGEYISQPQVAVSIHHAEENNIVKYRIWEGDKDKVASDSDWYLIGDDGLSGSEGHEPHM
jgi:hypothetical protein